VQNSVYRWTGLLLFKNGVWGSHGFPVPNIVRVGVFIVSEYLLFVLQIEYNEPMQTENSLHLTRQLPSV
jgi:hypothetical protein